MPDIDALNAALPAEIRVTQEIFPGGQRTVYESTRNGERCVLKLMLEESRARAEREVEIGKRFDHPNLSKVLDEDLRDLSVEGTDYVYFTERFVDGDTLANRNAEMEPCEAIRLGADLLAAVDYLWNQHHVVHRDIKPLNIMVRPDGGFVLLDIGVARHQDRTTLTILAGEHQPGTIGYLAPEQLAPLKGRELDYRADLFAIGIVMFEQLTGRLPFDPTEPSYRTRLTAGLLPTVDELSDELAELLARLMAPRPHGRYRLDRAREAFASTSEALGCS